jgi:hypothetical protein
MLLSVWKAALAERAYRKKKSHIASAFAGSDLPFSSEYFIALP